MGALRRWTTAAATVAATAGMAADAAAFGIGPHSDMTHDAFLAERYAPHHARIASINGFFVDLYENAKETPLSGHWGAWPDNPAAEKWPEASWRAADALHFDSTGGGHPNARALANSRELLVEFNRLNRATLDQALAAAKANSYPRYFAVLGISLHAVQDFYSHTNWVEPKTAGFDGPGWAQRNFGTVPTWADLDPRTRLRTHLYAGGATPQLRGHGRWNTNGNANLVNGANKDWEGRPYYREAYWAAYFHSRAWIRGLERAVRARYPAFARGLRGYAPSGAAAADLGHDVFGSRALLFYIGHWHGQGDSQDNNHAHGETVPGRAYSKEDLVASSIAYFARKTSWRALFEMLVPSVASPEYRKTTYPLASVRPTRDIQAGRRFVRLEALHTRAIDTGIDSTTGADFFVHAQLGSQSFFSSMIKNADQFDFGAPFAPPTFIKSVGRGASFKTPLHRLRVRIRTSGAANAGTDNDVFLRVSDGRRWELDRGNYFDFEKGDNDWYSIPLDVGDSGACPIGGSGCAHSRGLTLDDLDYIQIEKSPDGAWGGWKLAEVEVQVNGKTLMTAAPNRWLEDDDRSWRWSGTPFAGPQRTKEVPVHVGMTDVDGWFAGDHDVVDISPWALNFGVGQTYELGSFVTDERTGGHADNPRDDDDDEGRLRYRLRTDVIVPPPVP